MFKIVITEKGGEPKHLSFDKEEVSIGRVQGNDIVLPKGNISKRHTKLTFREGRYAVTDLKSTNGTYVNGRKIAEVTPVTAADKIYVGDFVIMLDGASEAADTPPPPRRPMAPPPPPPRGQMAGKPTMTIPPGSRGSIAEESLGDEESHTVKGSSARPPGRGAPPPPPPPPRREPKVTDQDEVSDPVLPRPAADEMEEEELAAAPPRRTVPLRDLEPPAGEDEDVMATAPRRPAPPSARAPAAAKATTATPPPVVADGNLAELLGDETLEGLFVSGPDAVYVEREGRIESAQLSLGDARTLEASIRRLAADGSPAPGEDAAIIDVRLRDGSRLSAILPPAGGPCAAIRRAGKAQSLTDLGAAGAVSRDLQQFLESCITARRNLLVTGSGAAPVEFARALCSAIPADRRAVAIGNGHPISMPLAGWVNAGFLGPGTGGALVRAAVGQAPDHLIVTDIDADSASDVVLATACGQEGVVCVVAGRSASEAVTRLVALARPAATGAGIPELLFSSFDLVVHVAASRTGGLRVAEVADLKLTDGKLAVEPLLAWKGDGDDRSAGRLVATGSSPRVIAALGGAATPSGLFRK